MSTIRGFNNQVACRPIGDRTISMKVNSGFATMENRVQLLDLEVVFGIPDADIRPGDKVYVKGDAVKQVWAGQIFTVKGAEVILVPTSQIHLIEHGAR